MTEHHDHVRKRRRVYGSFSCDFQGCRRVFSRLDHLTRHKKNHTSANKHTCSWPDCNESFIRSDVRDKHYKRHLMKAEKDFEEEPLQASDHADDQSVSPYPNDSMPMTTDQNYTTMLSSPGQLTNGQEFLATAQQETVHIMEPDAKTQQQPPIMSRQNQEENDSIELQHRSDDIEEFSTKILSPSDLIEWLFHDETIATDKSHYGDNNGAFSSRQSIDLGSGVSPMSFLDNMFAISPDFPHSNNRKTIDDSIRAKMILSIPTLETNVDFGLSQIERCLEIYWLIYHPQYPVLHRASFSNYEAHPLLLLAMIMLGASLTSCTGFDESSTFQNPTKLADEIALPLRWQIFSNIDCKPPAKVWVVQSLLLLESYEITSTSRFLHERAYLHHGTKIQLLRRSPILGGDPLKDDNEDNASMPQTNVWKKWIEVESMKRATLMAFYLDTVHATVYGHVIILYAHQIKISLPCDDELWEFDNIQQKRSFTPIKTPKFLAALKRLLHRQNVETGAFGRKILLAGLLTIMFQMQQKDLQLSFLEWDSVKESWQETISLAIDVWKVDILSEGGCCGTSTSLHFPEHTQKLLPPMLRSDDRRCKFSLYHISQIYMRITHYDYIIYAGAPSRMNVTAGSNEYSIVEKRILSWSNSLNGRISLIHSYLFLCEMLLSPDNEDITYNYDPNVDPFLHRKNIIVSAVLVIFAYNYSLEGPENDFFGEARVITDYYPDKEDGYSYLRRIRKELSKGAVKFHSTSHLSSTTYHNSFRVYAERLDAIKNKNNIVGLLKIFYKGYQDCKWEIGAEYSNLFRNCIERCLGRKKVTCDDMYIA